MKLRFPGFKILDRYILGKFLATYFFAIAMIIVVVVLFDYVEKIDDFTELHAPLNEVIFDYYLNFIPFFINQFSGLFTFIACIFFTSKMAYQTEIVAMLSGGMSFRRLMWPYFLGALIIGSLSLTLNLWLIPISQRHIVNFESQYIKRKQNAKFNRHIYRQIEPGTFAYIRGYNDGSQQASFLALEEYYSGTMTRSLEAADVKFNPETKRWTAPRYTKREFDSLGVEKFEQFRNLDTLINLEVAELGEINDLIQTMNITELNEFLDQQRAKGSDSINIIEVEKHARFAYPLSTFILTLIGVSLSSRKVRGGTGLHIGIGTGLCFSYILFNRFFEEFAKSGTLPARAGRMATQYHLPVHRHLPLPEGPEITCDASTTYAAKVRRAERIDDAEAARLWREAPLWLLGELATAAKRRVSGDKVYYNRNFHIEPTNRCVFNCRFCSYRRPAGDPEAWDYTMDEIEQIARERQGKGITEVHIVGGVHPDHGLDYYTDMIRRVKSILPGSGRQGIYGDRTIVHDPQGGTDDRRRGCGSSSRPGWTPYRAEGRRYSTSGSGSGYVPRRARRPNGSECTRRRTGSASRPTPRSSTGMSRNSATASTTCGACRELQDLTGGFNAFIPLKYRNFGNPMSEIGEVSVIEDLRMLAMSRIYLDNIPHIKAYWVMYGKATTELALAFGADDIDGTIDDTTRIYSMAGAEDRKPSMSIDDMQPHRPGGRLPRRGTRHASITKYNPTPQWRNWHITGNGSGKTDWHTTSY